MQQGICISISISICRSDKVLDYDRCWKGLDARHLLQVGSFFLLTRMCNEHGIIFLSLSYLNIIWPTNLDQEWERRSVPQHPGAQCLHQNLPWRIRLIQHQVFFIWQTLLVLILFFCINFLAMIARPNKTLSIIETITAESQKQF